MGPWPTRKGDVSMNTQDQKDVGNLGYLRLSGAKRYEIGRAYFVENLFIWKLGSSHDRTDRRCSARLISHLLRGRLSSRPFVAKRFR